MTDSFPDDIKADLERKAQLIAKDIVAEAIAENPSIDQLELKRIKRKALTDARRQVGMAPSYNAKRRTSVPPVEKQKAPPIPENPDEYTNERTPVMKYVNTAIGMIQKNKAVIGRRVLIAVGASVGMALTSTLVDRLGERKVSSPDIVVITPETEVIYTDPAEPDLG